MYAAGSETSDSLPLSHVGGAGDDPDHALAGQHLANLESCEKKKPVSTMARQFSNKLK